MNDVSNKTDAAELLKFINDNGIINLDDVRQNLEMQKNVKLLKQHNYTIWEGKNGRWYTYLPDTTKENNRRLLPKSSRLKIEAAIIEFYENQEQKFEKIYLEWLFTYKKTQVSEGTIDRIVSDYNKYYKGNAFTQRHITHIEETDCDIFIHTIIKEHNLNFKQYSNMSTIIRQVLKYAKRKKYITTNPMHDFELSRNILRKDRKRDNKTEVFMSEEEISLVDSAWLKYQIRPHITTPLATVLCTQTGMRNGELVALKWTDITDSYIYVQRTEIRYRQINKEGVKSGRTIYELKESPKSSAGFRKIFLTDVAKKVLALIKKANYKNGFVDSEFVFVNNNGRMHTSATASCERMICEEAGIDIKSIHKIRKTVISKLLNSNQISADQVREFAGHEDTKVMYDSYLFGLDNDNDIARKINNIL